MVIIGKNNIEIKLARTQYSSGETVKGKLVILAEKGFNARYIKFFAYGEEKTRIVEIGHGHRARGVISMPHTSTESNLFYYEDLSHFLTSVANYQLISPKEKRTELRIPEGSWAIPFEFTLPHDAFESYHGKNAWISYGIKVKANKIGMEDELDNTVIIVLNKKSSTDVQLSSSRMTNNSNDAGDNYQTKIHQANGDIIASIALKKKGDISSYSPGDSVSGKIIIQDLDIKRIRSAEVTLNGVEYSKAKRLDKTTIIQSYKQILIPDYIKELKDTINRNIGDSSSSGSNYNRSATLIPFEIHIPEEAKSTHEGILSRYYWELEAKINVSRTHDLYLGALIRVI